MFYVVKYLPCDALLLRIAGIAFALLQVGPVLQEAQGGTTQEAVAEQVQRRYLEKLISQREMEQSKVDND